MSLNKKPNEPRLQLRKNIVKNDERHIFAPIPIRNTSYVSYNAAEIDQSWLNNDAALQRTMGTGGIRFEDLLNRIAFRLNLETFNTKINQGNQDRELMGRNWELLSDKVLLHKMNIVGVSIDSSYNSKGTWSDGGRKKKVRKQTSFAKTEVISGDESDNEMFPQNNYHLLSSLPFATKINVEQIMGQSRKRNRDDYSLGEAEEKHSYLSQFPTEHDDFWREKELKLSVKMVGLLTEQERKEKVQRYLEKKKLRKGKCKVRYECRQGLAHQRFRYQGRFIKYEDLYKFKHKCIIDYEGKRLLKPIFKVEKTKRRNN